MDAWWEELVQTSFVLGWRRWVSSRAESLELVDGLTSRRTTRVVFSLETYAGVLPPVRVASDLRPRFVPLGFVPKNALPGIVTRDETGAILATLNRAESTRLAAGVLTRYASQIAQANITDAAVLAGFRSVAAAPPREVEPAFQALRDTLSGTVIDQAGFWFFVQQFATNYLLFAHLGERGPQAGVFTFEYLVADEVVNRGPRAVLGLIGWLPTTVMVPVSIGQSAAWEFDIDAPEGTGISVAQLQISPTADIEGRYAGPGVARSARLSVTYPPELAEGVVAIELAPLRSYMAGILLTAIFAAVVLTIGRGHLDIMRSAKDPSTALLLAGPTLFAGLIAQPGRGGVGAQLLTGARRLLMLSGVLTFTAAAALAVTNDPADHVSGVPTALTLGTLHTIWTALAVLAWISVGALFVGFLSPGSARSASRERKRLAGQPTTPASPSRIARLIFQRDRDRAPSVLVFNWSVVRDGKQASAAQWLQQCGFGLVQEKLDSIDAPEIADWCVELDRDELRLRGPFDGSITFNITSIEPDRSWRAALVRSGVALLSLEPISGSNS